MALLSAARRGIDVTLIVPEKVDSIMVRHASHSMFDELLGAGVTIAEYHGGLLHTKTITIDDSFTVIGSVNMDMRSLWLNFEISLFVYDQGFNQQIRELATQYLKDSRTIDSAEWRSRPKSKQLVESIFRLVSPLL